MSDDTWEIDWADPVFGFQMGKTRIRSHPESQCAFQACCIHHPSAHPLADAPLNWRADRGLMERICKHGVGHDDPDDLAYKRRIMSPEEYKAGGYGIHGCCGCCTNP